MTTTTTSAAGGPALQTIDTAGAEAVQLPSGFPIAEADFGRSGPDLVLTSPDGEQVVVRGFFAAETPPKLTLPDGAEFSGSLAAKLAGPQAPAQYAQAGPEAAITQPIGTVENLVGTVTVTRADGTQTELELGDPVFQGDILESGEDGAIGIVFADETSFSMAENGRMMLDEMIYDPGEGTGEMAVSVVRGVFTFVSGQIAKTDPEAMTIETPVATIGVRGTQGSLDTGSDGQTLKLLLMTELVEQPDGSVIEVVGELQVAIGGQVFTINQADFGLIAGADGVQTRQFTPQEIVDGFAKALGVMPSGGRQMNRYGVEERGGDDLAGFDTAAGEEDAPPAPDVVATFTTEAEVTDGALNLGDLILSVTPVGETGGEGEGGGGGGEEDPQEIFIPEPLPVTQTGSLILGTSGNDNIQGGDDNNTIIGFNGSDVLRGGGGDDRLTLEPDELFWFDISGLSATGPGALSSVSLSDEYVQATITRPGNSFGIENPDGTFFNALSPFNDPGSDTPFVFSFNVPTDFFRIYFGDVGGDYQDSVTLQAYSGLNGTGTMVASSTGSLSTFTQNFPYYYDSSLSVSSGSTFQSVVVSGGTAAFPQSLYYEEFYIYTPADYNGDSLFGELGNDSLIGSYGNDLLDGGDGDDRLNGSSGNDLLLGGAGNDYFQSNSGNDTHFGGAGNDQIFDYSGSNTLYGDGGNDSLFAGNGSDKLMGGAGDDYLSDFGGNNSLSGGDGNDIIYATGSSTDNVDAGEGNDLVFGGCGNDFYDGGGGLDTLSFSGQSSDFRIDLASGTVSAFGQTGTFTGFETVIGGNGDDRLLGTSGDDILNGAGGSDTVDASDTSGGVNIDLSTGMAMGGEIGTDSLVSVENAEGGSGDDTLTGNSSSNTLIGADGNDIVNGGGGNDHIVGGSGAGDDTYDGGTGIDTVDYSSTANGVDVALSAGSDQAIGSEIGTDQLSNIENVIGGSEDDVISGDGNGNTLWGGDGADELNGKGGNDKLDGGEGGDTLTGGTGDDIFRYTLSQLASDGGDRITDFTPGQDTIEIFSFLFGTGSLTNVAASTFSTFVGFTTSQTVTSSTFWYTTTSAFSQPSTAGSAINFTAITNTVHGTSFWMTTNFISVFGPTTVTVGNFKAVTLATGSSTSPTIGSITFANPTSTGIFVYENRDDKLYYTDNGGASYQTVASFDGNPSLTASDIQIVYS